MKKAMGLFDPLRDWKGGPLALFTAIVLTTAVVSVAVMLVNGLLGSLFSNLNFRNETGTFNLELGAILQTLLIAGISVFSMLFLLKGGNPAGELKDIAKSEEKKED